MQPWVLVSPASRGIGLELARRLLQTTKVPIVATARKDLDQTRENILYGLDGVSEDRLHVLKIDVLGRCSDSLSCTRPKTRSHSLANRYSSMEPRAPKEPPSHTSQTNKPLPTPPRPSPPLSRKRPPTSTSPWQSQESCTPKSRPAR
jgi:hypothetical protein